MIVCFIDFAAPLCEGIERVVEHLFGPRKQMSVTVEGDADRRMHRAHCDLFRMRAGGDPQCGCCVAEPGGMRKPEWISLDWFGLPQFAKL